MRMDMDRMRLINIKAFLEREEVMSQGGRVERQAKVLEFRDDETTAYAILSHRWIDPTEVDFEEMVCLAKMDSEERDEIRKRLGYKKIMDSCEQAKKDGYTWLWVDTCCIDKRSSAELSEAINSMYRWYENSEVCYVYLHDISGLSITNDNRLYPDLNGWPEWFSRGWTLQEMIAPRNVRFFNNSWQAIGDKKSLARTLNAITDVPEHILIHGLSFDRPCVAQIMSWAANRSTTRVEDRAYSLMGLLDVNMPMLYGEGKKAFHRLQLEIIRMSNDLSIFAWGCNTENRRTGSILADDPSFFRGCHDMELMDHEKFIQSFESYTFEEELCSIERDRFGVFPVTNRGIQIWLFLRPYLNSRTVFQAWLPCCLGSVCEPVTIDLALWNSDYYRYSSSVSLLRTDQDLEFRQLHLRYQDAYQDITFDIDDSAIVNNGLTCCNVYPSKLAGNTLTLTGTNPLCIRVYSDRQDNCHFAVALGQCFGRDWIQVVRVPTSGFLWNEDCDEMLVKGPERAHSMALVRSRGDCYGRVWVKHTHLRQSIWTVQISRVMQERTKIGVRMEIFQHSDRFIGSNESKFVDVEVGGLFTVHVQHHDYW